MAATTTATAKLAAHAALLAAGLLLCAAGSAQAEPKSKVFLNGVPTPVFFNDGDSFKVLGGPHRGTKARLAGFNTLESYGPVHSWGSFTEWELYVVAKKGTMNARRGVWHCTSDLAKDTYGRILWICPDLAEDQIRKGLAHAMTVTKDPSPERYLEAQREAIANKRGMWALGAPEWVLTSLHSADEGYEGDNYNRLVSSADGHSEKWLHKNTYAECQKVCHEQDGKRGACMIYVDYRRRFGKDAAPCLQK